MTTRTYRLNTDDTTALNTVNNYVHDKLKKLTITQNGNTITADKKVLWQQQTNTFTVKNGTLTITGNVADATTRAIKASHALEGIIDDQGWDTAYTGSILKTADKLHTLSHLHPTEKIHSVAQGMDDGKTQILAVTEQRVLIIESGVMTQGDRSIPLDKISSVGMKSGMMLSKIQITTSNSEIEVEKVAPKDAEAWVRAARDLIDNGAPTTTPTPDQAPAADGLVQLEKLAELHSQGILTDEEFAAAKKKALGL